jgi:hypothetical protein
VTERELRDPYLLARPLTPQVWLLRTLVCEPERFATKAERAASVEAFLRSRAQTRDGWTETAAEVRERLEAAQWRRTGTRSAS